MTKCITSGNNTREQISRVDKANVTKSTTSANNSGLSSLTKIVNVSSQKEYAENLEKFNNFREAIYQRDVKVSVQYIQNNTQALYVTDEDGNTPLHLASLLGKTEVVKALLEANINPNRQNKDGNTALHIAVRDIQHCQGYLEVVNLLIKNKADLNIQNETGDTPLHIASLFGKKEVVEALLEANINPNRQNKAGDTPLHIAVRNRQQCNEYSEVAKLLIKNKADHTIKNAEGDTALHLAAFKGNVEIFEEIFEEILIAAEQAGKETLESLLGMQNVSEETLLHIAASNGNVEIFEKILIAAEQAGKETLESLLGSTNYNGDTALYIAVFGGHTKVVDLLIDKGADPTIKNKWGNSSLYIAAYSGNVEICRKILTSENVTLEHLNNRNKDGNTALHIAVSVCTEVNQELVDLLLNKGADPTIKNNGGNTPLHLAAYSGNVEIFKKILIAVEQAEKMTPEHLNSRNKEGNTSLHAAVSARTEVNQEVNQELVDLLLNKGADPTIKNNGGNTPLHLASLCGNKKIVDLLIDKEVDLNIQNTDGNTPLHLASLLGYKEVVDLLLNNRADPTIKNKDGNTALHVAVSMRTKVKQGVKQEIVDLLLNKGADPTIKNNGGNTPLHLASLCGNKEVVDLLIDEGADPTIKNKEGHTPLEIAKGLMESNHEIYQILSKIQSPDSVQAQDRSEASGKTLPLKTSSSEVKQEVEENNQVVTSNDTEKQSENVPNDIEQLSSTSSKEGTDQKGDTSFDLTTSTYYDDLHKQFANVSNNNIGQSDSTSPDENVNENGNTSVDNQEKPMVQETNTNNQQDPKQITLGDDQNTKNEYLESGGASPKDKSFLGKIFDFFCEICENVKMIFGYDIAYSSSSTTHYKGEEEKDNQTQGHGFFKTIFSWLNPFHYSDQSVTPEPTTTLVGDDDNNSFKAQDI
ncbi:MAG: ankyrin repeat domain-containing protein [Rickettsiaceae bacterium]|nr:ankyrin repeat domain-containing protein [Rickettsiaceae bacterium]